MAERGQVRVGPRRAVDHLRGRSVADGLEAGVAHDLRLEAPCRLGNVHADVSRSVAGSGKAGNAASKGPVDHESTVPGYADSMAGTSGPWMARLARSTMPRSTACGCHWPRHSSRPRAAGHRRTRSRR